jgi:hypothetical protein
MEIRRVMRRLLPGTIKGATTFWCHSQANETKRAQVKRKIVSRQEILNKGKEIHHDGVKNV